MPAVPIKRRIQSLGVAESVRVEADEFGFLLYLDTDKGPFVVNVHAVLGQLLEETTREVTRYLADAQDARATENPETYDGGYSVHADLYDMREGK